MKSSKKVLACVLSATTVLSMASCGAQTADNENSSITVDVWAWEPALTPVAEKFQEKYPNIKIKISNVGTAGKEYTNITNALQAGSGAPDIAQIEYFAIPEFVLQDALMDLSRFGADKYADFYTAGPWNAVTYGGGIHGLPMDSGPDAFFYNKEVFEKAGVDSIPQTWDDFYEVAKKVRAQGSYLAADAANPAIMEVWLWAAGAEPVKVDGEKITINYAGDSIAQKYYVLLQKMIDEDLIDTKLTGFTDDWYKALNNGDLAGMTSGAWMASMLKGGVDQGAGKWRVALMPQISSSTHGNGEDGGSSLAILKTSKKADAAYKFIEFAGHEREGINIRMDKGQFPADVKTMSDNDFLTKIDPYFGDQKYQDVLVEGANNVGKQWQFLPYEVYARNIYGDYIGKALSGEITVQEAIEQWQNALIEHGKQEGFNVVVS
ncbi:ABC transporter substrate-binding protein [Bifidobacterium callitrichidarum]|uniref:ABC transporter substrate-binding protein n=1 Tax=Bifidobacterium callitrichidarum TaxID=2052941 RepID=A0A2U2NCY9_9BIFI|nr:sugar ABC transporter substrate-binding protein [Bifidobacterium callitrichidarum]PWG66993.1 ABC transporter substrate-binding protein [Bifidobacterium callitrichidarum]